MSVRRGRWVYIAVHKYVGLVLGAWIALIGLTGAVLIYQRELEALQHPDWYRPPAQGERLPLQSIHDAVRAAYPDHRIAGVERDLVSATESWKAFLQSKSAPGSQVVIVRQRELTVFVDPFRATVLGEQHGRTWLDAARDLHIDLLVGPMGRTLTGLAGIVLLISIIAGVVLWWPSRKRFWKAFTLRWTGNTRLPRKMWDLHHVVGIYSLVVLLIVTITGVVLIFQSDIQALASHVVDVSPTPVDPNALPDRGPIDMAGAERVIDELYPGATIRRVAPPTETRASYLFQIVPAGRSNMFTANVHVKAATGQVAYIFDPARQAPARSFIGLWSVFVHNGAAGGVVGRWLVLLSGLSFALLLATGLYIWAKRSSDPHRAA